MSDKHYTASMTDRNGRPIIIIKKKVVAHAGHHGGAWKVAYADFATAMMSLFIVLWLMNSNAKVKQAVAGYFKDPAGVGKMAGTNKEGRDKTIEVLPTPAPVIKQEMEKLKSEIEKALRSLPDFEKVKNHIMISVTDDGVRMELMETARGLFFENGSPTPTRDGWEVLRAVGKLVNKLPNRLMIEGHTDSVPFAGRSGYTNWELSSDRVHAARMIMESAGLRPGQLSQIRGFGDQQLYLPNKPADPANRRISVIVLNLPRTPTATGSRKTTQEQPVATAGALK
jgi:chemotaxis protein MotB